VRQIAPVSACLVCPQMSAHFAPACTRELLLRSECCMHLTSEITSLADRWLTPKPPREQRICRHCSMQVVVISEVKCMQHSDLSKSSRVQAGAKCADICGQTSRNRCDLSNISCLTALFTTSLEVSTSRYLAQTTNNGTLGSFSNRTPTSLVLSHTTYTCAFKPGCLISHNWLHTPDCKVRNENECLMLQVHSLLPFYDALADLTSA